MAADKNAFRVTNLRYNELFGIRKALETDLVSPMVFLFYLVEGHLDLLRDFTNCNNTLYNNYNNKKHMQYK